MTDSATLKLLETAAIGIAREAGAAILQVYDTPFAVDQKKDHSPVTEADLIAHDIISRGLGRLQPLFPILSEEGKNIPFEERTAWASYWLIDPLDGTREFVKRNGEFAVNIALIENGTPVIGVVLAPVLDCVYFASRDNGAFKQQGNSAPHAIAVRAAPADGIVVAGSRSHANTELGRYLQRLGPHKLVSFGSALKACMVAEGVADIYPRFGPTSEWDTAAAHCILEQAGGRLTDTEMQTLRYNSKPSLLNPNFFAFGDANRDWSQYIE